MKLKTKFILTYVAGIVTGCIVFFVISCIIVANNSSKDDVVMFDKPRNTVPEKTFKVFQVFSDGSALSSGDDSSGNNLGLDVLFLGDESTSYYDDQKIEIPKGKVARQIGNYSYTTNMGVEKTVPIVEIMDEQ
ncbi:hypothetical protein DW830_01060 [Prevotella sp. AM34-19LB]|jgi:hypothetical protein|nr:hypothetical protein [Prevotella sp. AM34-19LB]RHC79413.1 hypothetical protein DW830_01060 [Prevotella sp. AM34-19LB]